MRIPKPFLFFLMFVVMLLMQVQLARAQTATATATSTPARRAVPTPTVVVGKPCSSLSTANATIGQGWCQDQSATPWVLKVFNGVAFVPVKALARGITPPSSAPDKSLWLNSSDEPYILEKCDASACASLQCTSLCGAWNPMGIPNYGPVAFP